MKLEQLQAFFPPARHADIEALYRRFLKERRVDEDVEGFIIHLFNDGVIAPDTLREILAHHEVSLSGVPVLDESEGTPYRLVCPLGEGAMGEVFLARDPHLQRTVAVKRLKANAKARPAMLQRFFTEAQITAQLDHPAIVPIYGLQVDNQGRIAYAMKYVRGRTLKEYVKETRAFYEQGQKPGEDHSLKARIEAFLPVLAAMDYAHRRGIIHRDLKPENIMLGAFGEVLVMDWGIARPIGKRERVTSGEHVENTRVGTLIGTPFYMSPEQAQGLTEQLDDKSDQYSLGLILHELVTLQRAISGDTQLEVVTKAASGVRSPVVHAYAKEKIPRELIAIIDRATAKDPDQRYPDTDAFGDDLRRFLRDESVHADPDRGIRRLKRWVGRHRGTTMALAVGTVMMVAVVGAVLLWQSAVALREEREAAYAREQRLQSLTAQVNAQASRMNSDLRRFERLVHGIVTVAEKVLTEPPTLVDAPPVWKHTKAGMVPPERPDGLIAAPKRGGGLVSFEVPDMTAAPQVDLEAIAPRVRQLASLGRVLKKTVLWSYSDDALFLPKEEQQRVLREENVPLVWAYVAVEEGLALAYPGTWTYTFEGEGYDPREMDWYKAFARKRGIHWSTAGVDESGLGILMTCAESVFDRDGRYVGLAGVDMTLKYFIDALLEHPTLAKTGAEFLILDELGQVIVRSSLKDEARSATSWKLRLFDQPKLVEAAKSQPSGHVSLEDGRLAVWSRLDAVAWFYVVIGDPQALLAP